MSAPRRQFLYSIRTEKIMPLAGRTYAAKVGLSERLSSGKLVRPHDLEVGALGERYGRSREEAEAEAFEAARQWADERGGTITPM